MRLRKSSFATFACTIIIAYTTTCHSFATTNHVIHLHHHLKTHRKSNSHSFNLFRELISDREEDLRADIQVIKKQDGLDSFLEVDDRLCVIK